MPARFIFFGVALLFSGSAAAQTITSYSQFKDSLTVIGAITDAASRNARASAFWNLLKTGNQIPFRMGSQAAFLYKGTASSVSVAGDFTEFWSKTWPLKKSGLTDIWIYETAFPPDARLDYQLIINSTWMLDPNNPDKQLGGYGYNSEIRMPGWQKSEWITLKPGTARGMLSSTFKLTSSYLGYAVNYKVFTPNGYSALSGLPVLYITDGHEYAADEMGSMVIVLDNLIAAGKITPMIAVFIDPRNPSNSSDNRRMSEYNLNDKFVDFVCKELVPAVDGAYRTKPEPGSRGILGTSMGGLISAYFAAKRPDLFGLIGINSPAFWYNRSVFSLFSGEKLPVKLIMTTGVIYDTQEEAREMESVYLKEKGYEYRYIEVNESHSWGNWRALADDVLMYLFPAADPVPVKDPDPVPQGFRLEVYPNPFNPVATLMVTSDVPGEGLLELFTLTGQRLGPEKKVTVKKGTTRVALSGADLSAGVYLARFQLGIRSQTLKVLLIK